MAHVISLVSSKGGTGKTTTALNLAVALAERGRRTVLVDFDPQGSIGLSLAKGEGEWTGLAEVLLAGLPLDQVLVQTRVPALSILPRGRLDAVDVREYEILLNSPAKLADLVAQLGDGRQYVIVDCPSGLGIVTRAALASSGFALVPLQAEPLALRAVGQVLRVIDHVQKQENPALRLLGILPTMVELRKDTSLNVMGTVWAELAGVLDTAIPRGEAFARAIELGLPVSFMGGRTPPEARRFEILADEIERLIAELTGAAGEDHEKVQRQLV